MAVKGFTYAGVSSADYGVNVNSVSMYGTPERDLEMISIPGKSGDVVDDNGRYRNRTITYSCTIIHNFRTNIDELSARLASFKGYQRLEDTFSPEYYRRAVLHEAIEPDISGRLLGGDFDISFDCDPYKYLVSGETALTWTGSGSIENPTYYTSQPLIRVTGSGTLEIGDIIITVASNSMDYIDIDCGLMRSYCGATNCDSLITLTDYTYPELEVGTTGYVVTDLTSVQVTPRWRTI